LERGWRIKGKRIDKMNEDVVNKGEKGIKGERYYIRRK
jgi:hypothetical protein